nr:TPA_asm: replicase [Cardamom virus X]
MALLTAALDRFTDVSLKSVIQEEQLQPFRKALKDASTTMPYAASPAATSALEKLGILTNPFAANLHTHAAAKAVENQLLQTLGHILPQEPVTFYFLKRSKLNQMRRNTRIKDVFNNMNIEPRDFARYPEDTLREHLTAPTTSVAYISDTLHFLKPHFLVSLFRHNPVLKVVYATMVLPPEALYKHPSQMPAIYTINYDYGGFQYLPGGHGGASYHHEFKQLDWLRVGKMVHKYEDTQLTITAQMMESLGANHLFIFTRGDMLTPRVRTFSQDECVVLPKIFHPSDRNTSKPLSKTFAMQLLLYVKSVKEVTFRDICAKIRQLIPTSDLHLYQPDDLIHVANFFYFTAKKDAICHNSAILDGAWIIAGFREVYSRILSLWHTLFGQDAFGQLLKALEWKMFTYSLEPNTIHVGTPLLVKKGDVEDLEHDPWALVESEEVEEIPPPVSTPEPTQDTPTPTPAQEDINTDELLPWHNCRHILTACGFKGDQKQYREGQLISPISDIQQLPDAEAPEAPPELIKQLEKLRRHPVMVSICNVRGKAYASDIKNNRVGACTRNESTEWKKLLDSRVEHGERDLPMIVIHGAGGSGKSYVLQNFLRAQEKGYQQVGIVLPTVELRADWMAKVPNVHERCFRTFEKALIQLSPKTVIMDDYTKLPAGFIETFVLFHPEVTTVILTGDPKQTSHHESNDQASSAHLAPAVAVYSKYCRYYLNATHRNRKDLANKLGIYSELEGTTRITQSATVMHGWPIIAPSLAKKTCLTELGHRAYSYAGCQGLTTPNVQVLLDNNTALCSAEAMYTTLSRARDAIHFIQTGPTSSDYWEKISATPYLKTFLNLHREEVAATVEKPASDEPAEPSPPPTHFPVENAEMLLEPLKEELCDKFDRELFDKKHGHTNAIQTEDTLVQLFQHQQAKDEALLFKTIEARIKIGTPRSNEIEFIMKKDIGDILFLNYQKAMGLPVDPIPFQPQLWQSCQSEVQNKYLEKPYQALVNGKDRQSPDFPTTKIALFLKSQWVKKTEKIGALKVKPGQTIASFMQQTVMLYGTMARYMRRIRSAYQPENIFITCENTPEDLNEWVLEHWDFTRTAHSNDFTAFDQSQDGAMLQFEVLKAKHHSIPEDIIEGYVALKTNAYIFLGTIAVMRLSGEGPTFDANTECAIAYHHTKYHVEPGSAQLYAGDDMAQDSTPKLKKSFELIEQRLELKSKEVTHAQQPGNYATFCGWVITPVGIIKEPKKLYASLQLAKHTDKTDRVKLNYTRDLVFAYRLGDRLHSVLTDEEAAFHQATVRDVHLMGTNHLLTSVLSIGVKLPNMVNGVTAPALEQIPEDPGSSPYING